MMAAASPDLWESGGSPSPSRTGSKYPIRVESPTSIYLGRDYCILYRDYNGAGMLILVVCHLLEIVFRQFQSFRLQVLYVHMRIQQGRFRMNPGYANRQAVHVCQEYGLSVIVFSA